MIRAVVLGSNCARQWGPRCDRQGSVSSLGEVSRARASRRCTWGISWRRAQERFASPSSRGLGPRVANNPRLRAGGGRPAAPVTPNRRSVDVLKTTEGQIRRDDAASDRQLNARASEIELGERQKLTDEAAAEQTQSALRRRSGGECGAGAERSSGGVPAGWLALPCAIGFRRRWRAA